jgi:hypothetical protein
MNFYGSFFLGNGLPGESWTENLLSCSLHIIFCIIKVQRDTKKKHNRTIYTGIRLQFFKLALLKADAV